jgi:SAM-dependent methyltransferase
MEMTGERFVPELRGQIAYEHLHRYEIARRFAGGRDVLDVASGEGYGASYLAQVAKSVVGVDIDAEAIRHAASRYAAMNLRFRVGSASQLPLADDSFDLVVSFETIEHLVEQEEMLAEIGRVLRADGKLIISSPNKLVYSDLPHYQNPFHLRELYFDEFRELLLRHFSSCAIFGHRIFAASAVHPLVGVAKRPGWLGMTDFDGGSGLPALPAPTYFLAVCGGEDTKLGDLASIYIDPHHDLLTRLWDSLPVAGSGSPAALDDRSETPLALGSGDEAAEAAEQTLAGEVLAERIAREELQHAESRSLVAFLSSRLAAMDAAHAAERTRADMALQRAQLEVEMLKAALVSTAARLTHVEAERSGLSSRLHECESELQAVMTSRSWRMTSALRTSAAALRGRPK